MPSSSYSRRPPVPSAVQVQIALAASLPREQSLADRYRFHPEAFLQEQLNIALYPGFSLDWVRDVAIGWLHGHARERYNRTGLDPREDCLRVRPDLPSWEPGQPVVNTFVFQGGAGLGKSVVMAGILLWAGRVSKSFTGVVYAPFVDQAYRTTWRYLDAYLTGSWEGCKVAAFSELLAHRKGAEKDPSIERGPLWSISTKAVNQGSARVQGQHAIVGSGEATAASVHVFEEADAIDDPGVFDAVKTMTDKNVALWILGLNPATPTAPVQALRGATVQRYELSVLDHPNVIQGRTVIPGASDRGWVESKLGDWAEEVGEHDPRAATFCLKWLPNRIFKPHPPWWWRVLGKVPPTGGGDSAVPEELYLAACSRDWRSIEQSSNPQVGTLGVDVARSDAGQGDSGAIYRRWRGVLQRVARIQEADTRPYVWAIVRQLREMAAGGCEEVEVRIDAGGGFGGGVRDQIIDHDVGRLFASYKVILHDFGGKPRDSRRTKDWITEAYLAVAQDLRELAIASPPSELRGDLCSRKLRWEAISSGSGGKVDVVALEQKRKFRERIGRSPDDGDALALACYPRAAVGVDFTSVDGLRWTARKGSEYQSQEEEWLGRPPGGGYQEDASFESLEEEPFSPEGLRWRR